MGAESARSVGLVGRGEEMDSAPEVTYSVKWFGRTSALEGELKDASKGTLGPLYSEHNVDPTLLRSALELGEAAAQIDEIVHATGIWIGS
jgi:hypothetical protein